MLKSTFSSYLVLKSIYFMLRSIYLSIYFGKEVDASIGIYKRGEDAWCLSIYFENRRLLMRRLRYLCSPKLHVIFPWMARNNIRITQKCTWKDGGDCSRLQARMWKKKLIAFSPSARHGREEKSRTKKRDPSCSAQQPSVLHTLNDSFGVLLELLLPIKNNCLVKWRRITYRRTLPPFHQHSSGSRTIETKVGTHLSTTEGDERRGEPPPVSGIEPITTGTRDHSAL